MFNEILKISYDLLKKNTNLSQHLFLFFLITMFLVPSIVGIKGIFFIVIFFLFTCAFFAGWLNAIKTAYQNEFPIVDCFVNKDNDSVEISNKTTLEKEEESLNIPPFYFKEFFEGVGKYFFKFLFGGIIYVSIFGLIFYALNYFIHHFMIIPQALKSININTLSFMTQDELNKLVLSLTQSEKLQIIKIAGLISGVFVFCSYLIMLFPIALINSDKNVLYCLFSGIKSLLKNIPVSALLFIIFSCLLFLLTIGFSSPQNLILFFISFILYCYLSVLYYISLFVYYEKTK